ncbi:hypothetical protein BAUCODRAFT_131253 [Baudoinia panamericana UAMH 10762]|uniref:Uncharacterized protein n=1 Tax=Baudoinia panamericana (strain UAMH 10762) TaxID=717646 RepID=M2MJ77_BAUPA|nr:uncharacterized protein BAUCODRAFT_131253 [Baudoinia panamericana UAMH 10762]EMC96731.1 hypothetical protein BAUCODRAFT_131253 [Baudoinia panamericana UAMH 10762]
MGQRLIVEGFHAELKAAIARVAKLESEVEDRDQQIVRLNASLKCSPTSGASGIADNHRDQRDPDDAAITDVSLKSKLAAACKRNEELESLLALSRDEALCMDEDVPTSKHNADIKNGGDQNIELLKQISTLQNLQSQLRDVKAELATYKTAEAALREQLGKIKNLTGTIAAMQISNSGLTDKLDKATKKHERVSERLAGRETQVQRLRGQLPREKEARSVAETKAKSGCSSKACKSCKVRNPITVDPMDCD